MSKIPVHATKNSSNKSESQAPNEESAYFRLRLDELVRERFGSVSAFLAATGYPKDEAPTPDQVCRAIAEMGEFAPLGEFAALTGLRRNELLYLEWPQVNWERGEIRLKQTKNGKPHTLPLPRRCLEILDRQRELKNQYCFPGPAGRKWNCATHHKMWRPAFDRAGMENFVWHDLRHAMASAAVASGASLYTTSTLLNHSGTAITKRYAHLPKDMQREALEKVSVYFSGTSPG